MDFSADWFKNLDAQIRAMGMDSDAQSFDEILQNLTRREKLSPDGFAEMCAYVILAGGFSQKTAKRIHKIIMDEIRRNGAHSASLLKIFNNKNKIGAICKIWESRDALRDGYYVLNNLDDKIKYLQNLPHIGKITANHLARNLGEDVVKYDIWIQRLGCAFANDADLSAYIDNGKLCDNVKSACDDMFAHLACQTGLPRGYIDVVLWKACQLGLIKL